MDAAEHQAQILDQFTLQAEPFLNRHGNSGDALLALMAECAAPSSHDALLDIACGPGIVSCFFAPKVKHVTGLDMVPAMLDRARKLQADRQLNNIDWKLGQATELPFATNSFDCVVTRFSFHHFLDPQHVLREMARVCKPGGTVLVADVTPSKETQPSFNEWEILRDPSHTSALLVEQLHAAGQQAGLAIHKSERFGLVMKLEELLMGSFPKPGDADRIQALFEEEIGAGSNRLGVAARRTDRGIEITYPVSVVSWCK